MQLQRTSLELLHVIALDSADTGSLLCELLDHRHVTLLLVDEILKLGSQVEQEVRIHKSTSVLFAVLI